MSVEAFTTSATEGVSVVRVGSTFHVTHHFQPAASNEHLYEARVTVTVENVSARPADVRYRRVMHRVSPEPPSGVHRLTIQRTRQVPAVAYAGNGGRLSADPFDPCTCSDHPMTPPVSGDAVDTGPANQGTLLEFDFGELAPGATRAFSLFFGAAANGATALAALGQQQVVSAY